jgi:hypothetical protein
VKGMRQLVMVLGMGRGLCGKRCPRLERWGHRWLAPEQSQHAMGAGCHRS